MAPSLSKSMKKLFLSLMIVLIAGCASLPERKPWTKWDKICGGIYMMGKSADWATTENMLDSPNNYELNPILGRHPSDSEIALYMATTGVLVLIIADLIPKIRKPLLIFGGVSGSALAIHNSRLSRSSH